MRTISETFAMLHGGTFTDECSEALKKLVINVDETGKAGKLTITLDLKKAGGAVAIDAKVTTKTPEPKADADLFWPTTEGNLSLQNPNQQNLDLRDATPAKGELRTAQA
jgi:hypothetical protein